MMIKIGDRVLLMHLCACPSQNRDSIGREFRIIAVRPDCSPLWDNRCSTRINGPQTWVRLGGVSKGWVPQSWVMKIDPDENTDTPVVEELFA